MRNYLLVIKSRKYACNLVVPVQQHSNSCELKSNLEINSHEIKQDILYTCIMELCLKASPSIIATLHYIIATSFWPVFEHLEYGHTVNAPDLRGPFMT